GARGTESANSTASTSSTASASGTESTSGKESTAGTGTGDTGGSSNLTKEESSDPISAVCKPPDMENCYEYEDMQAYLDQIIPVVEQFFDAAYTDMPAPARYVYVSEGDTGSTGCADGYTDEDYAYCPTDETIYTGQRSLWKLYSDAGDAAPAVGLAHEWGHHVQNVAGVPPAETSVGQISRENQADCIAGAWIAHADEQGLLNYPDDLADIGTLLEFIAQDEPGRDHGDLNERTDSVKLGIGAGLQGCNDFFPDSPVITSSSTPPASGTASPSSSPSAEEEDAVTSAATDYYRYAESGDYATTYDLLSSEDQSYYTQDEWVRANTILDSANAEYVVTDAYPDDLGLGVPTYAVTVTVDLPDGSSLDRTTYFVYEAGYWAHYLSEEEIDTFDGALN
ncbi:MAG: neutral zinc metallopeptidase, partial [Rubrobacter sp.]